MSCQLANHLLETYHGFADKRVKDSASGRPIRVDDRTEFDRSPVFCGMFVRVTGPKQMLLSINNLPMDEHVRKCLTRLRATIVDMPQGNQVEIPLTLKSVRHLKQLSTVVRRVVGRGRRYVNANWKWICPRTAKSLERLAQVLEEFLFQSAYSRP